MSAIKNFFQHNTQSNKASAALLLVRVVAGIGMMFHGWAKIQSPFSWMGPDSPVPGILQALAALSEFGGGLALVLGLLTSLAMLGLAVTMAVAVYMHAIVKGDPFVGKDGSYELAAIYFVISVLFIVLGPGKYSLDNKLFGHK